MCNDNWEYETMDGMMKLRLEVLLYCTRFLYENSELNWLLLLMLDSHSACVDIIIKSWKKQDKGMHKTA